MTSLFSCRDAFPCLITPLQAVVYLLHNDPFATMNFLVDVRLHRWQNVILLVILIRVVGSSSLRVLLQMRTMIVSVFKVTQPFHKYSICH